MNPVIGLAKQLEHAQSEVERLKRQIGGATCSEIGACDWVFQGGKNAGCRPDCCCSVPVHTCLRCGDCDYGDTQEADEIRAQCEERLASPEEVACG